EHRDFPHDGCILGRLVRARNVEPPTAVMSRPWRRRREAEQITMTGGQAARRRIAMSPGARFSSSVVFAVLGPCRGLPRSGACEGPDERASAEAERILYFTLVSALERALVRAMENLVSALRALPRNGSVNGDRRCRLPLQRFAQIPVAS